MGKEAMAATLKISMVLILVGWACVWVLMPTELWRKSWHKAEDHSERSIFGYYSLNLAVFSLPILILAMLGYIYLHLCAGKDTIRWRKPIYVSKFSVPLIVHSPIGIISTAELLLALLFMTFLAWTFYSRVSNDFKKMNPAKSLKLDKWQFKMKKTGIRFGSLAEACLALLLLPVLRGMSLFRLVGIQFENSVRYHIWLGNALMVFATSHGCLILFGWGVRHKLADEIPRWQRTGRVNIAGVITLATGLIIWASSLPQIRRKKFELFYYTHHLYIVFLVFFLLHAGDRHFYTVLSGVLLFALDKILRIIVSGQASALVSACILPCRAVELNFSKPPGLKYTPSSIIFIKIPNISRFQWHPFSLISCANTSNQMSVIVKCDSNWSNQLYRLIQDSDEKGPRGLTVAVEGPYGPPDTFYECYDSLLLIAGGIGITPFLSILQDMENKKGRQITTSVSLIYAVKRSQDLSMLNSIYQLMINRSNGQNFLQLHVYVTQEEKHGATLEEVMQGLPQNQRVFFQADSTEDYTKARLQSTLTTSIITGLSFVIYLVSIVALNHAFLGSGKGKSKKSPSWVTDLLVITSFIIALISSTLALVLLRWTKSKSEIGTITETQDINTEMHMLGAQGFLSEHEIHFHRRPNFTDVFSKFQTETGGCRIGVLVCGPKSMQESVASVCRTYNYCSAKRDASTDLFSYHSLNFAL